MCLSIITEKGNHMTFDQEAYIVEKYVSGTDAGQNPLVGTHVRKINAIFYDEVGIELDLTTNRIAVPGGLYRILAEAPYNDNGGFEVGFRILDIDNPVNVLGTYWGLSGWNGGTTGQDHPVVNNTKKSYWGQVLISNRSLIEVIQWSGQNTTLLTSDLGRASGGPFDEIYATLTLQRRQ